MTGKTAALTAVNGGTNTATKFAWSVTTKPSGATIADIQAATNTYRRQGVDYYILSRRVLCPETHQHDFGTTIKTATITFTVQQTLTTLTISPTSTTLFTGSAQQFTVTAKDQFAVVMSPNPECLCLENRRWRRRYGRAAAGLYNTALGRRLRKSPRHIGYPVSGGSRDRH